VRLLRAVIDGVPPFEPIDLVVSIAIMVACAAIALAVPLRRAVRVDPILALRVE
jgi:ABC-type antimicrobial peptide transport system permease subunit